MKSVDQIRKERLATLVAEAGGVTALASAIKRSASQVSQWLNSSPDSRTQKPRTISNASARYIEQQSLKPFGWMDQPTDAQDQAPPPKTAHVLPLPDPPEIAEVLRLMRATDDRGRLMALGAVKHALADHKPAVKANGVP